MNNVKFIKKSLKTTITDAKQILSEFVYDPNKDFSRNRDISFEEMVNFVLTLGGGSLKKEIYDYFGLTLEAPTSSAMIQQREKVKPEAFEWMFHRFNELTGPKNPFVINGISYKAVDGCSVPIYKNRNDLLTYIPSNDYCAFHVNALFDLLTHTYDDVIIQGEAVMDENTAFNELVDRYNGGPALFVADRGYESYNSFEHVKKSGNYYLVRAKDIHSNGICSALNLPDEEFDIDIKRILTRRYTNEIKAHPEIYKYMPQNQKFDYFGDDKFYEFECRIVRFKVKNQDKEEWQTIITNLDRESFSIEDIKEIYHLRWSEETSFRELKYYTKLNALHSRRRDMILQEIYGCMLFYNFSERIIRKIKPRKVKDNSKHVYQINSSIAFYVISVYIRSLRKGGEEIDIESIIASNLEAVRPNRSFERKVKPKTPESFMYRLV